LGKFQFFFEFDGFSGMDKGGREWGKNRPKFDEFEGF